MKFFTTIAIIVFSLISLLHLLRYIFAWQLVFNDFIIPQWVSLFGFILPGLLAFMLWRESRRK